MILKLQQRDQKFPVLESLTSVKDPDVIKSRRLSIAPSEQDQLCTNGSAGYATPWTWGDP